MRRWGRNVLRDWKGDGVLRSAVVVPGGGEGGGGRGMGSELPVRQGRASRSWPGCPQGPQGAGAVWLRGLEGPDLRNGCTDPGQPRGNAAHPRERRGRAAAPPARPVAPTQAAAPPTMGHPCRCAPGTVRGSLIH